MTHCCERTHVGHVRREIDKAPAVAPAAPSHAEIARLAYAYWEGRGRQHGCHLEDWYRAERELLGRRPSSELFL
jgi:hypothetical protein